MFKQILSATPDLVIYILIPTILAFWTYRDIYVLHSKQRMNYVQLGIYVLTMLVASLLFRIGRVGVFPLIVTGVYIVMAMIENRQIGMLLEKYKEKAPMEGKKNKSTPPAITKVRLNFIFSFTVAVLSILNYFHLFNFLSK